MPQSLQNLLSPPVFARLVSQLNIAPSPILARYGMQDGGTVVADSGKVTKISAENEVITNLRSNFYNVYNDTRASSPPNVAGGAATVSVRNRVGQVAYTIARLFDCLRIPAEEQANIANIENTMQVDSPGGAYLQKQILTQSQKADNWRLMLLVGMLRGESNLMADQSGAGLSSRYLSFLAPTGTQSAVPITSSQMPPGNRGQLNMLGAGNIIDVPWSNPQADIINHFMQIQAASQQLNGSRYTTVECSSQVWRWILNNDTIQTIGGIAGRPYSRYEIVGDPGAPVTEAVGQIDAIPGVTFYISDATLEIGNPGSTATVPIWSTRDAANPNLFVSNLCVFSQQPKGPFSPYKGYVLGEEVAEYDNGPRSVKVGRSYWTTSQSNPTTDSIFVLDNFLPINESPSSIAAATVSF
jgi:hypothetical protein